MGKKDQDEMRDLIKLQYQELHDSFARVTALIGNANESTLKVQASLDKIAETEGKLNKLTSDLNEFASVQGAVITEQTAKFDAQVAEVERDGGRPRELGWEARRCSLSLLYLCTCRGGHDAPAAPHVGCGPES